MEIEGLKSIPFCFICFSIFYHCYQWLLPQYWNVNKGIAINMP
jgi:hypothetical protein